MFYIHIHEETVLFGLGFGLPSRRLKFSYENFNPCESVYGKPRVKVRSTTSVQLTTLKKQQQKQQHQKKNKKKKNNNNKRAQRAFWGFGVNKTYIQKEGVTIGSRLGEKRCLYLYVQMGRSIAALQDIPIFYKRFIDVGFGIWTRGEEESLLNMRTAYILIFR